MSDKLRFGEILVRANVLERGQLEEALREAEGREVDLGEVLCTRGYLDETTMLQTISKALNLPSISLESVRPDERAISLVPRECCVEHFLLPVEVERSRAGEHLHVAMANPSDVQAIKRVTRLARLRIRPLVASAREIRAAIQRHYGGPPVPGPQAMMTRSVPSRPSLPSMAPVGGGPPPPVPRAAPANDAASMFDFGVTDLSALDDGPELAPPPPPPAPATSGSFPRASRPPTRLNNDLVDALDSAAQEALVGTSDLSLDAGPRTGPPTRSDGFGLLRRTRRGRPGESMESSPGVAATASLSRPSLTGDEGRRSAPPLPPLPPALRGGRAEPPVPPVPSAPPRVVRVAATETPLDKSDTLSTAGFDEPPGLVDESRRHDLRDILDRYVEELDEGDSAADDLIAEHLQRFGQSPPTPAADALFDGLEQALARTRSPTGRMLVALIRQLARRGLVDPDELISDLRRS